MKLTAIRGSKEDVLNWLRELQSGGCVRVVDAVGVSEKQAAGEPVETQVRILDPRRVNVFLASEGGAAES